MSCLEENLQERVEIHWICKPLGVPVGERSSQGVSVVLKESVESDLFTFLDSLGDQAVSPIRLCVLEIDQYRRNKRAISDAFLNSSATGKLAFVLLERDSEVTTRASKAMRLSEPPPWISCVVRKSSSFNELLSQVMRAAQNLLVASNQSSFKTLLAQRDGETNAINEIGLAITSHASVDSMVKLVLEKAIDLCSADAGFILLRENLGANQREGVPDVRLLRSSGHRFFQKARVCKSQNLKLGSDSLDPARSTTTSYIMNHGIGVVWEFGTQGPVPHSRDEVNPIQQNLSCIPFEYDSRNYEVRSYCQMPLKTPSGEVVGIIVLVNCKVAKNVFIDSLADVRKYVRPFTVHELNLMEALASQVGVSLDHARLIQDLKKVFESFVQASVVAIESRDPSTKGHSERVAVLTVGLAEAVNGTGTGQYGSVSFNATQLYEIKYASLLHDFGKIGVRENILRKERKLYHHELMAIQERFHNLEKKLNLKCLQDYLERLMNRGQIPSREDIDRMQKDVQNISSKLHRYWENILEANEPSIVSSENFQKILEIASIQYLSDSERASELLLPDEVEKLTIKRGSLSYAERLEIESHVTHSFKFLMNIPWTQELANVPDIVYAHHERLDGTGYPRQLVSDEIPIQAKMMAIADVYDALVAVDRPYKLALPAERALNILEVEVMEGKLDSDLFKIFVEARIGELIRLPNADEESAA